MYEPQNEMVAIETTSSTQLSKGTGYMIAGWVCFAISLLFFPILFGAVAFGMGLMTYWEKSEFHGIILMGFAALGTLFGMMISLFVAGSTFF